MEKIIKREEQRPEDTWDLEAIYASAELWEKDAEKLKKEMEAFQQFQGYPGESGAKLKKVLDTYCEIRQLAQKLYVYANMHLHENMGNSGYQKMAGQSQSLMTRLGDVTSWLEPEILLLEEETLERFLKEEPGLEVYRTFLRDIFRQKAHTLTPEQEKTLALARELGEAPDRIYTMFQNADLTFEAVTDGEGKRLPLTGENFVTLETSTDRSLRKDAFEKLYHGYEKFGNTLAAMFDANVRQAIFFAKERHYGSTLEASLDGPDIPTQVYRQLIGTVEKNLPYMHRYVSLRKKLLEVPELHMYDVYVPMVADADQEYSFEEAKEIVLEGLKPLGEEYLSIVRRGMQERWIDVYANEGKRGGAYSWGSYGTHPYILMNYQGKLNDVFTLAHEMGHSMHSYYTRKNQPFIYGSYHTFVAEVASTCNEALLIHSLLEKTSEPRQRKFLLNHFLEQFKGTLFRQTMFAEFEQITHSRAEAGESLTSELLCDIYLNLNKKYFGPQMVSDPEIAWEWARIPHFYTPFYVYQYATGFSAAIAIAKKIRSGEAGAVENYKRFLSGGSSLSPIGLLKLCGVDMTRPEPVQDALDMFQEYLGYMEEEPI